MSSSSSSTQARRHKCAHSDPQPNSLLAQAVLGLLTLCMLIRGHHQAFGLEDLNAVADKIRERVNFSLRPAVQAFIWIGAILLMPKMIASGILLISALALILAGFYALIILLVRCLAIASELLSCKVSRPPEQLLPDLLQTFVTRFIPPAQRPPLLTA